MRGIIKFFNSLRGFGFISVEDSEEDFFVHHSDIVMNGFRSLEEGDNVEFEVGVGEDGREKAINVSKI